VKQAFKKEDTTAIKDCQEVFPKESSPLLQTFDLLQHLEAALCPGVLDIRHALSYTC
jgi:hypothetical protein